MGKGGKGAKKATSSQVDEDELLNQAIAENLAFEEKATRAKVEADAEKEKARAEQIAKEVASARRDRAGAPLSRQDVAEKLNGIPCFCVVDASKQFVPLRIQDTAGLTEDCCFFWSEPVEAKHALAQAVSQRSETESTLGLATIPLGKAFALCEGWAEASTSTGKPCKFQLRAHARLVEEVRPQLTRQLEHAGLDPAGGVFPLFLCEELTTDTVMPIFLSRVDVVSTWEAAIAQARVRICIHMHACICMHLHVHVQGRHRAGGSQRVHACIHMHACICTHTHVYMYTWEAAIAQAGRDVSKATPPSKITVLDLRMLARRMQSGGMDWSLVTFVGTDHAFQVGDRCCLG